MGDVDEKVTASNREKLMTIVMVVVIAAAAVGFVQWSKSQPEGSRLSRAFCADLDAGLTLMNLWPRDMDPAEFADDAWGYIATTCPEHYLPNKDYFDGWNKPVPPGVNG